MENPYLESRSGLARFAKERVYRITKELPPKRKPSWVNVFFIAKFRFQASLVYEFCNVTILIPVEKMAEIKKNIYWV